MQEVINFDMGLKVNMLGLIRHPHLTIHTCLTKQLVVMQLPNSFSAG